ncbi:hypothetical protein RUND412_000156 [Rhizina undulata]
MSSNEKSGYVPPHLKYAGVSTKEYVEKLRQSAEAYRKQPVELFARLHLGENFDGDLSVFIEAVKKSSSSGAANTTLNTSSVTTTPIANTPSALKDGKPADFGQHKIAVTEATGRQPTMAERETTGQEYNRGDVVEEGYIIVDEIKKDVEDEDWDIVHMNDVEKYDLRPFE